MTTTITSEASATGPATDDQVGHLKGLIDPRLRRLSNPSAQIIIRAGGKFQERFNQMIDQLLAELVVQAAIDEALFDYKYVDLPVEQFPLTEEPVDSIEELHFNERLTTRQILANIDAKGKKSGSPLTALRYAIKHLKKQLDYPMAVIFEIDGQLWYLILYGIGSGRGLNVRRCSLDGYWYESYRFLVVVK